MNVLDLFSGIGGFSLGLERAGMRTVAFCEIDPFCRRVLAKHWPGIEIHEDVTKRGFVQGEADIITAGFPCQDISFAGEGAGLAGERSGLYRHVIRAIRLVRPRFAVLENVAALLSRGLGTVLGDMAAIGYDAEWHCIPASAAGAPHRRDRIWIIADAGSEQYESNRPPLSGKIAKEFSKTLADANGEGLERRDSGSLQERPGEWTTGESGPLGDPIGERELQQEGRKCVEWRRPSDPSWWSIEPDVGRVAYGVPSRMDRLKGLGNAVVPQIPEIIGRAIMSCIDAPLERGLP